MIIFSINISVSSSWKYSIQYSVQTFS